MPSTFNCPQCGSPVPARVRYTKLIVCSSCGCSLLLEDDAVKHIGKRSIIADYPSIFRLGGHYRYRHMAFTMQGRVQYDYGGGYWDEWWVIADDGEGKWISVDEGDISIEAPIAVAETPPAYDALQIGDSVSIGGQSLRVTEKLSVQRSRRTTAGSDICRRQAPLCALLGLRQHVVHAGIRRGPDLSVQGALGRPV